MMATGSLVSGKWVSAPASAAAAIQLRRSTRDLTECHALFTFPHRYDLAVDIRFTPVREACYDTVSFAPGQNNKRYRVEVLG